MIEPLDLNFASRPFKNNTLLWVGYGLGVIFLVAFAAWNITTYVDYHERLASTKADLTGIENKLADLDRRESKANKSLKLREYNLDMLTSQTEGANGVIEWKAFSWTGLFNHMEAAQPWNVYLASVRPLFRGKPGALRVGQEGDDAEDRSIVIAVEGYSRSLQALLDFERSLFEDTHFDRPEPKRHQPTDSGEIVFELEFTYYPEGMASDDPTEAAEGDAAEGDAAEGDVAEGDAAEGDATGDEATGDEATGEPGEAPQGEPGTETAAAESEPAPGTLDPAAAVEGGDGTAATGAANPDEEAIVPGDAPPSEVARPAPPRARQKPDKDKPAAPTDTSKRPQRPRSGGDK